MRKLNRAVIISLVVSILFCSVTCAETPEDLEAQMKEELNYIEDVYKYDVPFMSQEEAVATETPKEVLSHEKADNTMLALGLMSNFSDGSFKEGNTISKGEFNQIITKIKYGKEAEAASYGKDAADSNPITHEEAIREVLSVLGYVLDGDSAQYVLEQAYRLKVLDGISYLATKHLTRGETAQLISNALVTDITALTRFGEYAQYSVLKDETLLYKTFKTIEVKGFVTAAGGADMYASSNTEINKIRIDKAEYYIGDTDVSGFFGRRVYALATEDDAGNYTLIMLNIDNSDNAVILTLKDLSLSGDELSFVINGEEESVSLGKIENYVYNGAVDSVSFITNSLLAGEGSVLFSSSIKNGDLDTLIITEYKNFEADLVPTLEESIFFKYDLTYNANNFIDLTERTDRVTDIVRNGKKAKRSDIKPGDIISVSRSKNGAYTKIVASDNVIKGTVEKIENNKFYINGTGYYLSSSYNEAKRNGADFAEITPGLEMAFKLSADGYIVSAKKIADITMYGILNAFDGNAVPNTVNNDTQIKVFNNEGDWETYKFAKKATVDGVAGMTTQDVYTYLTLNRAEIEHKLVRYKLNVSDEVIFLDTLVTNPSEAGDYESLVQSHVWDGNGGLFKLDWTKGQNLRGSTYQITTDAIIFFVPSDLDDIEEYKILSQKDLIAETQASLTMYNADDYFRSKLCVFSGNVGGSFINTEGMIINDVIDSVNKKGEPIYTIKGLIAVLSAESLGWQPVTYTTTASYRKNNPNIASGMLVHYNVDTNGDINITEELISSQTAFTTAEFNDNVGYDEKVLGTVVSVNAEDSMIRIRCGAEMADKSNEYSYLVKIMAIYDSARGKATNVTLSDVRPGDKVYLRGGYRRVNAVVFR